MKRTRVRGAEITTLVGIGTTVTGNVCFSGGLHLEGRVEGNIEATDNEARLDVSDEGYVVGEIQVGTVIVNGTVEGDIHSNVRLILGTQAHIDGNVYYNVLEMAAGAAVNGKLLYRPQSEPLALEHQKAHAKKAEPSAEGIAADAKQ
ncbi:MAG: polymer-forming cytoskeletal protein [Gammaproteobacteria bacterium]